MLCLSVGHIDRNTQKTPLFNLSNHVSYNFSENLPLVDIET